jgi:outer membrane biosynthesis protein TonB
MLSSWVADDENVGTYWLEMMAMTETTTEIPTPDPSTTETQKAKKTKTKKAKKTPKTPKTKKATKATTKKAAAVATPAPRFNRRLLSPAAKRGLDAVGYIRRHVNVKPYGPRGEQGIVDIVKEAAHLGNLELAALERGEEPK